MKKKLIKFGFILLSAISINATYANLQNAAEIKEQAKLYPMQELHPNPPTVNTTDEEQAALDEEAEGRNYDSFIHQSEVDEEMQIQRDLDLQAKLKSIKSQMAEANRREESKDVRSH